MISNNIPIPIYQHPFVDVFKHMKLTDWVTSQKEGDVQANIWDKELAKNIIRIQGTSSSSNYIQVPATKFLPKKALGLTGKYIFLMIQKPDQKNCVIHLDYMINETRLTKISLSNIYKEFKNVNGSSLQIPLNIQSDKWTVVCLNIFEILENNKIFLPNQPQNFFLRSLQICSTVNVKGIYTSDIQYQATTLPKDMQFKLPKDSDWYSDYSWFQYPKLDDQQAAIIQKSKIQNLQTENPMNQQKSIKKRPVTAKKSAIQNKSTKDISNTQKKEAQGNKNVKFGNESESDNLEATTESETHQNQQSEQNQKKINYEEIEEFNGQIEKTMKEIIALKEDYKYNLKAKDITKENDVEVTLYQNQSLYDPKSGQRPKDQFVLKPNPIMRLDRVVGWHPHYTSNKVFFNHDPKLSKEIIYTQANMMLGFYPPLQKQRLFYERQTNNIDQLFVENCADNNNFAFTICKSLEEKSKDNEITIWSLVSLETTNSTSQSIITFKPPLKIIISINVSCGEEMEYLCLAGKDQQMRDIIIVYKFQDLIKFKKVEIFARQLVDFETLCVRMNPLISNSIIACGKEGIKLFKIKNGHLPGNAVILNNTARGKYFSQIVFQNSGHQLNAQVSNQSKNGKPTYVYVTTHDGLLYFVNYNTRQIDKIIQIYDEQISNIVLARNDEFIVSVSLSGIIRIWSTDFENLKSEVKTGTQVNTCDINYDCNQICVLSTQNKSISILDLESSSYNVVLRSHSDNLIDVTHNLMTGKLVTIGDDYCVKIWHADTMEQLNEFVSENDLPIRVVCQNQGFLEEGVTSEHTDSLVAIGFKSGFLRVLDLDSMAVVHETMLFQSPLMDIQFSLDNKFMAVFFKSGKIVIINKERPGVFSPVKNIDYELPNQNYCSISFSIDSSLLANISSNANTITVWETRNFSLRYHLDITGDLIQKIEFAPNGRDLVLLTTSSKIKVYRLGLSARDQEMSHVKDYYGITDLECVDFTISSNNKFIICAGKEGIIKVYDYFMRGYPLASTQAFLGHFKYPKRIFLQKDMKNLYSVGDFNGIYKWTFYGEKSLPHDITEYCEELEEEKLAKANMTEDEVDKQRAEEGIYDADELQQYTQKQIDQLKQQINDNNLNQQMQSLNMAAKNKQNNIISQNSANPFIHTIDMNSGGYLYEQFELKLSKVLACSNGFQIYNNLVWNISQGYIAYTMQNVIVIESLNQEKTQRLLKEGHDQIYQMKMSPSKKYLLAYSKTGPLDGFPCIYIYDSINFKKLNQIAISDGQIDSVEFSGYSNMLLVVSSTRQGEESVMTNISVWDFIDGHKDIFCKSVIPIEIKSSCWNPYIEKNGDEFVTLSDRCYHYWRITENLQLQYQEGELPQKQSESFQDKQDMLTSLCFVKPDQLHHSVYLMIGLKSGYIWVCDTRVNQYLFNVRVLDASSGGIQRIYSSHCRIVVEPANSQTIHCWDQSGKNGDKEYSAYNPFNFFIGIESKLTIDGNFKSTFYDDTGNQIIVLSSSGSIWYLSWIDNATLRLKSCHNPQQSICSADYKYISPNEINIQEEQEQGYTFDQNYQISSASSDGQIKLWNMYDLEYSQQFIVPKERCITIAMHQFKPYMVCSFTDGYLRFFDLSSSKLLGRCLVHSGIEDINPSSKEKSEETESIVDTVISIKILPSGNHILIATKNGQVILIFVQSWNPMAVRMISLVSIHTSINQFEFSYLEPYNKWLISTANGKVVVYNRKDFNSLNQEIFDELKPPVFNYMDSFNILEFVSNGFSYTQRCNTLDHYYSMAKRNLVYNEVDKMHECEAVFSKNDLTLHLCFIRQSNQLIIRNFELHQVVKRIEMSRSALPITMQLMPTGNSPFICVALTDNTLKLIDYMNEDNQSSIQTMHEKLITMKVCPNGRYVLTGGSSGDISLWSIQKKILQPDVINHAIKQVAA